MTPRLIRTEAQYREYLEELQQLIENSPAPNSVESDRLEVLAVLIENYEASKFPVEPPDPIDAILFRMNEMGLKQIDLVPYFGTRSRVSEVLNRKRPLTLAMIRALSSGLGISAETLISEPKLSEESSVEVEWSKVPVKEIVARGWISATDRTSKNSLAEAVKGFIREVLPEYGTASFRRSIGGEAYSPATKLALFTWLSGAIHKSRQLRSQIGAYNPDVLDASFMRELAQLSWFDEGPKLAIEFLGKHGVAVVIEPALKGTLLDGAALRDTDGTPIVALTLRHDRLDNFWFTLLHEVAHLWKHVDDEQTFLDDLDASSEDRREAQANRLAREAMIPRSAWERSRASKEPSVSSIDELSRELKIHPAIIAGRIRRETGNYRVFGDLLGKGEVRSLLRQEIGDIA